ncbi:N-glycosylase/DNA lyase [Ochlerotatus camptorhynchus]|uniref:N-glycosylase/DNA lyase n=1 Tax=Ochlerotatus camptorhynchus TaxID=644619 RepID=UPI0031D97975
MAQWMKIACLNRQLQLKTTLTGGQSFRWKQHGTTEDEFIGVFANIVWILKQTETELLFRIVGELSYPNDSNLDVVSAKNAKKQRTSIEKTNPAEIRLKVPEPEQYSSKGKLLYPKSYYISLLRVYFRLDVDLEQCYQQWNKCHTHFENSTDQFYAVRQLDQDPVENLFSFICSQNNNISRISGLVEKICTHYGEKICDYSGAPFYNFPDVSSLAPAAVDDHLRQLSFGYRAKYIQKSAEEILAKGNLEWFRKLRHLDYKEAHRELLTLTGIGPKVADCICLMSLNHLQAIPVDTHVFQIARNYLPHLAKCKAVSGKMYGEIGDKFREIYGPKAGWAQTVLFCADLRQFKEGAAGAGEDADGVSETKVPAADSSKYRRSEENCEEEGADLAAIAPSSSSSRPMSQKPSRNQQQLRGNFAHAGMQMARAGNLLAEAAKEKAVLVKERTQVINRMVNHAVMSVNFSALSEIAKQYFKMEQEKILQQSTAE